MQRIHKPLTIRPEQRGVMGYLDANRLVWGGHCPQLKPSLLDCLLHYGRRVYCRWAVLIGHVLVGLLGLVFWVCFYTVFTKK